MTARSQAGRQAITNTMTRWKTSKNKAHNFAVVCRLGDFAAASSGRFCHQLHSLPQNNLQKHKRSEEPPHVYNGNVKSLKQTHYNGATTENKTLFLLSSWSSSAASSSSTFLIFLSIRIFHFITRRVKSSCCFFGFFLWGGILV